MSQEGYADPVMNDGPEFHSIIPISELTEHVTRARLIKASNVSSAPPVVRHRGRGNAQNSNRPLLSPTGLRGSRHRKMPRLRTTAKIHEFRLARSLNRLGCARR